MTLFFPVQVLGFEGQQGGQLDFLSTGGYEKMGLPGDMVPSLNDPISGESYANFDLGLGFLGPPARIGAPRRRRLLTPDCHKLG